jgi:hypothetical protein
VTAFQPMLTGLEGRDFGVKRVDANTPDAWRIACDIAIAKLASTLKPFTAEDVRATVGDPPNHPNAMGARFLAAARAGLLEKQGYTSPSRPSSHASVIAVWCGKGGKP